MIYVVQINDAGNPTQVDPVASHSQALDLLERLAKENEVQIDRETLKTQHGFFISQDDNTNGAGCWMVVNIQLPEMQ